MTSSAFSDRDLNMLRSMRMMFAGRAPECPQDEWCKALMEKDPIRFQRELRAAELEFAEVEARQAAQGQPEAEGPDEGGERAGVLIERLLSECADAVTG